MDTLNVSSSYHMDTHSNNSMKWATGGLDPPPLRMGLGMAYAGLYLEAGGGKEISHAIEGRLSLGCNSKCCSFKYNPKQALVCIDMYT